MCELIPLTALIAEKTCDRLDRALFILEDAGENPGEHCFVEVAAALYEAQQLIQRLVRITPLSDQT
jgi:hypothetical protein